MNNFLEQLQSLDERTKSRVLVITTIAVMAVVIYFWLGYFNSIVSNGAQPAMADANQPAPAPTQDAGADNQPGFFTRMGNGFAIMGQAFAHFFEAPSKYIVKPN